MITISLEGTDKAIAIVKKRIALMGDFSEPFKRIVRDFYRAEEEWFQSQGGSRWRPLNARYAADRRRLYPGRGILRRTDDMWRAVTGKPGDYVIERDRMRVLMTNTDYWQYHQTGTRHMPKREVLSPALQVRKRNWDKLITDWVSDRLIGSRS